MLASLRVAIQTWGTEGDIRPFFALGSALAARGHRVRVVYTNIESRDFGELAASCGIEAVSVGARYFEDNRARLAESARASFESGNPIAQVRSILEDLIDPVSGPMLEAGRAAAAEADVFVSHFLTFPGHVAAEVEGRPHVMVGLVPMLPTSHHGPVGVASRWPFHRAAWWLSGRAFEAMFGPRINALRARVGLPRLWRVLDPRLERARLALTAVSPTLLERPPDWPERAHVCGFLSLPEQAESPSLAPSLEAFVGGGRPPAFLSFGSLFNLDLPRASQAIEVLGDAAVRAGERAVVQAPAQVIASAKARPGVLLIDRAPHSRLFPRCSVVVHHGGAGTTQSALLAGRPSIVVPHIADQYFWGDVLARKGAAPTSLVSTKLTASRLADKLREVAARPELAENAARLGRALSGERGAERAAELIERAVGGS